MTSNGPPGPGTPADPIAGGLDRRRDGRQADKAPEAPAQAPAPPPPAIPIEPPKPGRKPGRIDTFPSKLSKKQKKLLKDQQRPLDSWERYRALTDVLDEAIDLVDLADHKARFALVIMATVNVAIFYTANQFDLTKAVPGFLRPYLALYLLVYILLALYFFLQAIESLRPRKSQPQVPATAQPNMDDFPLGIRFYEDILRRDVEEFKRAWKEVRMGQLNAELAVQAHALAGINRAKYNALRRLYSGLKIMTLLGVGLVGLAAAAAVVGSAREVSQATRRGEEVLGTATRIAPVGVKEPSGIAFHPPTGRLFVVGDEGALAELDGEGRVLQSGRIEGQIEDLATHTPSGNLVLVSETRAELVVIDPATRQEKSRWPLDLGAVLGTVIPERNQGFEGLAFRPEEGRPGGGLFYLTHQRSPAMVVALAFDPTASPRRLGPGDVVSRWSLSYEDLTAVTWAEPLGRLLVLADAKNLLLVVRPDDGAVEAELPVPGRQQEGLALDASGGLWIADDQDKSVFRIPDAVTALKARLPGGTSPASGEPPGPGPAGSGTPRARRAP